MMKWKSIIEGNNKKLVCDKIDEIAATLINKNFTGHDNSLMYGNMGIAIFLFYYYKWKERNSVYKKASMLMMSIFDDLNKRIHLHKLDMSNEDLSFRKGLCGIGWGINHLVKNNFIDCDIQETMCLVDASIYREMIMCIQNSKEALYQNAFDICRYAVSRDDRLSKEYLRRFVNELYELPVPFFHNDIGKLLPLLYKIHNKYPDIELVEKLYDNALSNIDIYKCNLTTLLFLAVNTNYKKMALEQLLKSGDMLMGGISDSRVDKGLEHGIILELYSSNLIYQNLDIPVYRNIIEECVMRLFEIPMNKTVMNNAFWATSSLGLWSIHYGLLNGLAGMGLSLLSVVSECEVLWDDVWNEIFC